MKSFREKKMEKFQTQNTKWKPDPFYNTLHQNGLAYYVDSLLLCQFLSRVYVWVLSLLKIAFQHFQLFGSKSRSGSPLFSFQCQTRLRIAVRIVRNVSTYKLKKTHFVIKWYENISQIKYWFQSMLFVSIWEVLKVAWFSIWCSGMGCYSIIKWQGNRKLLKKNFKKNI